MSRSTLEAKWKSMSRGHPCRSPLTPTKEQYTAQCTRQATGEGKRQGRGETAEKTGTEVGVREEPF